MRKILKKEINNFTASYIGSFPQEKAIFFYYGKGGTEEELIEIYKSALEAIYNGYSVFYTPSLYLSSAIEKAFKDTLKGRLYSFIPTGLESVNSETIKKPLLTGGGIISLLEERETFSFSGLLASRYLAILLSSAVVICNRISHSFLETILSEGKDVAILKSTLKEKRNRTLAQEGIAVIDSFSKHSSIISRLTFTLSY